MRRYLKVASISLLSAIVGGAIVAIAFICVPAIRSKITSHEQEPLGRDAAVDDILKKQKGIQNNLDSLFDDDFAGQKDPFEEMRKMREQMERRMGRFGAKEHSITNPFDSWFTKRFGGGTANDISKREDKDFVYYDISVDDINSTSINTKVENGYITITGSTEKSSGGRDRSNPSETTFKSTFSRTFPLPDHVDQNKMQMSTEKNKIILKFPKIVT